MIVNYVDKKGENHHYSIENWIVRQLDKIIKVINKQDRDYVLVLDGEEGGGKSTLASQLAYYVDPSFNESRMCLTPNDFMRGVVNAKKGQAVVFDEAFTGLASKSAMSAVNKMLVELMMEMRKKNLFVIICLPSVFYLEKYVALHRARGLFHTYMYRSKPGKYRPYNRTALKQLYLFGRTKMSYAFPRVNRTMSFYKGSPIDWDKYEGRKIEALKSKVIGTRTWKQIAQRDTILYYAHKELGVPVDTLVAWYKKMRMPIDPVTVRASIRRAKKDFVDTSKILEQNEEESTETPPKSP